MANNKATIKLIDRAYTALDRLNDVSISHYRDKIYELAARAERQHRRGVQGRYYCSVATAAKMHVVRWLVTYATRTETLPTVKELLSIRDDVQLAAMVVANYRDVILKSLQEFDLKQLQALDYVALVEGREQQLPEPEVAP